MSNEPLKFSGFVSNRIFKVPAFQRAYAWEERNLRDFISDLANHPKNENKSYYLGTVLLTSNMEYSNGHLDGFSIVDGQQRLTTSTLFLSSAANLLKTERGDNDPDYLDIMELYISNRGRRKFFTIDEDDSFFGRLISEGVAGIPDSPSQRRIAEAFNTFTKYVRNVGAEETLRLCKVLGNSRILYFAVNNNEDATQIFELQNDRGKRLTELESLKSYLMHHIYLCGSEDSERDLVNIQSEFAAIFRILESIEGVDGAPGEDEILAYHCFAFQNLSPRDRPKDRIKTVLASISAENRAKWIKSFACELKESFNAIKSILLKRDDIHELGSFFVLGRQANYWPLMIKCWLADNKEEDGKKYFLSTMRMAERFVFRSALAGRRSDYGESAARNAARDFKGDFTSLVQELESSANESDFFREFQHGMSTENFYGQGEVATYFLWKYENHLRNKVGGKEPLMPWRTIRIPDDKSREATKDHIEPKDESNPNLGKMVRWNTENLNEELQSFRDVALHRVGNLVLDTRSTGASKGNGTWEERKIKYLASTMLSQRELVEKYEKDGQWTIESIRARQKDLELFAQSI